jgi:hypothetical protein
VGPPPPEFKNCLTNRGGPLGSRTAEPDGGFRPAGAFVPVPEVPAIVLANCVLEFIKPAAALRVAEV